MQEHLGDFYRLSPVWSVYVIALEEDTGHGLIAVTSVPLLFSLRAFKPS